MLGAVLERFVEKARSLSWSALHSSACWAPIASICGMSAPRRSHRPRPPVLQRL